MSAAATGAKVVTLKQPAPAEAHATLRGVTRIFQLPKSTLHALGPIDLDLAKGEFFSVVGPSGGLFRFKTRPALRDDYPSLRTIHRDQGLGVSTNRLRRVVSARSRDLALRRASRKSSIVAATSLAFAPLHLRRCCWAKPSPTRHATGRHSTHIRSPAASELQG